MPEIDYRFKFRRGLAATWTSTNPVILDGEAGWERDSGKLKIGDGVTAWTALGYLNTDKIPEGGNLYFTTERAQDAVAALLVNSATVSWAYDDALNALVATASVAGANQRATPSKSWDFWEHGLLTTTSVVSFVTTEAVPVVYLIGAGAAATLKTEAGAPGIVELSTGTATTGSARMFFCPPMIRLGGGAGSYKVRLRVPVLSTALEAFAVVVSMVNVISGTPKRIGAIYAHGTNSGQWTADVIDGGTTSQNSTIAVTAAVWIDVELIPNAAGTSWQLKINGVAGPTVTATLPTDALGLNVQIIKSAGSLPRLLDVDLGEWSQVLTTAR